MAEQFTVSSLGWIGAIGTIAVVLLLTLSSTIDIARTLGVRWPNWFFQALEQRETEKLNRYLDQYEERISSQSRLWLERVFDAEEGYIRAHQDILVGQILHHFGIPSTEFDKLREHAQRLRHAPRRTKAEIEKQLGEMCKKSPILVDTSTLRNPLYGEVRYYLNFVDAMANPSLGASLTEMMASHIRSNVNLQELDNVVIVTPANGNVSLGLETARSLRRPFLFMREKPRVEQGQYWDGSLPHDGVLIIVHDVAVSGDQLVSAYDHLKNKGYNCSRVFCLVERTDKSARSRLAERSMSLIPVLQLDDAALGRR
ncbi:phosphoribosyltransferase [Methylobacterium sp. Gmos1]